MTSIYEDRCPSVDPYDELRCGRRTHDDEYCRFGAIAWRKGTPRVVSDRERADDLAARLARVEELADEWESREWHPGNPRQDCATLAARRLRFAYLGTTDAHTTQTGGAGS